MSLRERLVKSISQRSVPLKQSKQFLPKQQIKELEKHSKTALKGLEKSLKDTERTIRQIIEAHADIK